MGTVNGTVEQETSGQKWRASFAVRAAYVAGVLFATFEVISIYSVLVGSPAVGALQALALVGVIALVLIRMAPSVRERRRAFARVALTASVAAIPLAFVLWTRATEAQGAAPEAGPFSQLLTFLLFQAGLALTHWLSAERGRTDQARFVPGAIGSVILIIGSFMATFGGETARAAAPGDAPGETFKTFATAEDYAFAQETQRVGAESGSAFAHFHSGSSPLLGLSFGTRDWFGRERVGDDFQGIFEEGASSEGAHRIVSRSGFAVAALEVQADDHINAVRVQFAPFDGSRLSTDDRYWSDWAGSYELGRRTTLLDSGSALVVGLRGTSGMVLNSLSLLVALPEE
ncbi:MAG: hypothetical protein OEU54_10890 [Gemmatimonadota bacterium]|nr:hypothetical protein [Gemmatimonadota bacterium]